MILRSQSGRAGVILLVLGLFVAGLVAWWILSQQTEIPTCARVEAIERRYSAQLDRLREQAMSTSNESDNISNLTPRGRKKYEKKHQEDRALFSLPEILSASAQRHAASGRKEGRIFKIFTFRRMQLRSDSATTVGKPAAGIGTVELKDGSSLRVVRYEATLIHPSGQNRSYEMLLDLDQLERAVRIGRAGGTGSQQARMPDTFMISGTVVDEKGNPVEASLWGAPRRGPQERTPTYFMDWLADCDEAGCFEIRNVKALTYDIIFQTEENVGDQDTVTMRLKSQTVTVDNADVDLGKINVPVEATRNRYIELGLLSPPENVRNDRTYFVIVSDHQAPVKKEGIMQAEYQAIYIVNPQAYFKGRQEACRTAKRVSGIGNRSFPAWNRRGDKIVYFDRSNRWDRVKIVLRNVVTVEESTLEGIQPGHGGISWDESGNMIAYRNTKGEVCVYDLRTRAETPVCVSKAEYVSLSPNAKMICFMM